MQMQGSTLRPSWIKLQRLERTETIRWMLEVSENRKVDSLPRERRRTTLAKGKEQGKMVRHHWDKRTRRKFKINVGISRKQVINQMIAGRSYSSNKVKDDRTLLERVMMRRASQARVEERKTNPKMLKYLCEISKLKVQSRARWRRMHCNLDQVRLLERSTRLNAQRWICARPQ